MPRRRSTNTPNGRLAAIAAALRSAGPAVGVVSEQLKPLPLDISGGGVAQSKLDEIAAHQEKALAAADYRLASEMHDLHTILSTPGPGDRDVYASYPDPRTSTVRFQYFFCAFPLFLRLIPRGIGRSNC